MASREEASASFQQLPAGASMCWPINSRLGDAWVLARGSCHQLRHGVVVVVGVPGY